MATNFLPRFGLSREPSICQVLVKSADPAIVRRYSSKKTRGRFDAVVPVIPTMQIGFSSRRVYGLPDNRFRVFYQVKAESREVRVLAVGIKHRNRLLIGGEEFAG